MPKRTIEEWLTVAKISNDSAHLFFEGPSDARVVTHASGYSPKVDFRSADEIDFETEDSHPLCGGNKLRLVALSQAASKKQLNNIKCLIDSDFALLVSHLHGNQCLFETGFANLPITTFTFSWLQGFMLKGYGVTISQQFWLELTENVKFCFVARFLSAISDAPKSAPQFSDYMSYKNNVWSYDKIAYIKSFFVLRQADAANELVRINEYCDWLEFEVRAFGNSNDIFDYIYITLKKLGKISGSTSKDAIRQAFFGAIDDGILEQEGMLQLKYWINSFS